MGLKLEVVLVIRQLFIELFVCLCQIGALALKRWCPPAKTPPFIHFVLYFFYWFVILINTDDQSRFLYPIRVKSREIPRLELNISWYFMSKGFFKGSRQCYYTKLQIVSSSNTKIIVFHGEKNKLAWKK